MKKNEWVLLVIAAAAFVLAAWAYPQLPSVITSHWDINGNPNGTMPAFWGIFSFPLILLLVIAIFFIIPRVDPKRDNIEKFRKYYDYFTLTITGILFWIFLLFVAWNLGYRFDFVATILPALAAMFWVLGMLLPHTKPNWTIGIRTPWTISSEHVWAKTHRVGGIVFKIAAFIALAGMFFPMEGIWFLGGFIIGATIGLFIYSYVLYEKEQKAK